jgi:flagellar biosynthetic protein FliR
MEFINLQYIEIQIFFLILLRVSAILFSLPMIDSTSVPTIFKIGMAFTISIVIFPIIKNTVAVDNLSLYYFVIGAIGEIVLGLIIGFSIRLIFAGIQLGGQTAGNQMGFGLARVIDPVSGSESNAMSQFYNITAILLFFAINAHHIFLRGIIDSFTIIQVQKFIFGNATITHISKIFGGMFVIAVKIGGPLIVALLLTSVALGLVARTVPQMNIFIVALPVKILGGMIFLGFCIPYLRYFIDKTFNSLSNEFYIILNSSY